MKQLICMAACSTLFLAAGGATAQVGTINIKGAGPMHPLCRNCHQLDTNMMRGSLENFSMASQTLQIDVGTHKETRAEMAFNLLKHMNIDSRYLNANVAIAKDGSYTLKE